MGDASNTPVQVVRTSGQFGRVLECDMEGDQVKPGAQVTLHGTGGLGMVSATAGEWNRRLTNFGVPAMKCNDS